MEKYKRADVVGIERELSGEHLIEHHADGINIGFLVGVHAKSANRQIENISELPYFALWKKVSFVH